MGFAVHYALLECLYIINERFPAWKGGALALLCFFADLTLIILIYRLEGRNGHVRPARVFLIINILIWAALLTVLTYAFALGRMS